MLLGFGETTGQKWSRKSYFKGLNFHGWWGIDQDKEISNVYVWGYQKT